AASAGGGASGRLSAPSDAGAASAGAAPGAATSAGSATGAVSGRTSTGTATSAGGADVSITTGSVAGAAGALAPFLGLPACALVCFFFVLIVVLLNVGRGWVCRFSRSREWSRSHRGGRTGGRRGRPPPPVARRSPG